MNSFKIKLPAYLVHIFTGTGVIFSFLALVSVIQGLLLQTFIYLGIALVIDTIDGSLARKYEVKRYLTNIDG